METAEIQTGDQRVELRLAAVEALTPRRTSIGFHAATLAQFLAVIVQFGLIVMVVNYWQLESLALARLMALAFVGFVIHHLLPCDFAFRSSPCCHSWQSSAVSVISDPI